MISPTLEYYYYKTWAPAVLILRLRNLSTRRSCFTNSMAGRAEMDRGRGLRAKMQIIEQTNVKPSRKLTEQFIWNYLSKVCVKFCFFLAKKTWFQTKNLYLCMTNIIFEEPRIWTSGFNLRIRVLKFMTATQERLDMSSGFHAAKILPVGVRSTKNVWFLSCLSAFTWCQQGSQIRHIKCHKYWYNLSVFVCVEKIKGVKTVFLEVPKNCLYSR